MRICTKFLAVLVCIAAISCTANGNIIRTSGDGGERCGARGQKCLFDRATCDKDTKKCVCNRDDFFGNGGVNCYRNNTVRTEVLNDPKLITYSNSHVQVPLPCRYFWTHVVTDMKTKDRKTIGSCAFQAYVFHHKNRGKFYVGGFDVAIKLMDQNKMTIKEKSIRIYGTAHSGTYTFVVKSADDKFAPQGPWPYDYTDYTHPTIKDLKIELKVDKVNNIVTIVVERCGTKIQFRPFDVSLKGKRRQPMIPHAAFSVRCAFDPKFESTDLVMGLSPLGAHNGKKVKDIKPENLNEEEYMVTRAIHSQAVQNSPFRNPECAKACPKLKKCDSDHYSIASAMDYCLYLLKRPRFIKCYDKTKSGERIMALFNKCVDVFCSAGDCKKFIADIKNTGCHRVCRPYWKLTTFLKGHLCPRTLKPTN